MLLGNLGFDGILAITFKSLGVDVDACRGGVDIDDAPTMVKLTMTMLIMMTMMTMTMMLMMVGDDHPDLNHDEEFLLGEAEVADVVFMITSIGESSSVLACLLACAACWRKLSLSLFFFFRSVKMGAIYGAILCPEIRTKSLHQSEYLSLKILR